VAPSAQYHESQSLEAQSLESQSLEAQSLEARSLEAQSHEAQSYEAQSPNANAPEVIVIGDVMVDIVVRPVGTFHAGSDTTSRIITAPGGSATNQAVAFAAAGARTHLVATIGDDELSRAAIRALAAAGVELHLEVLPGERTGVVVALVDKTGERSMFTDRGANLRLSPKVLAPDLFSPGRHLHLSGYDLLDEATRPAAQAALALAAAAGMTRSVDPSSAGPLASVGAAAFLEWTEGLDWCCANLEEGRVLTGEQAPQDVVAGLRRHYQEVALTLGAEGALFSGPEEGLLLCPADPVAVEDTTGAGDAFTGTFLARRLWGDGPEEALRAGLAAAARVVGVPGARTWT
jgi:sugar/nucleoside kinase (ribokinase family)